MAPGGRALIAQPLHSPFAFECAVRQILAGGTVALAAPFERDRWLRVCARLRPDWALTVPAQLGSLLAARADLVGATASVRTLMCDGQCPPSLRASVLQVLGGRVVQHYGTALHDGAIATELALALAAPEHTALPGAGLRIVDERGEAVEPGRVGLIQGRVHTHPVGSPCPALHSVWSGLGERGRLTDHGRLIVTDTDIEGRAVIGAVSVAIERVRDKLARHPAVTSARVRVTTDALGGHLLTAQVETASPAVTTAALRAWCAANLDAAERPAELTVTARQEVRR
jgi:acyl-coenzyme A synthetase/AMP-(fatty) acid ligase